MPTSRPPEIPKTLIGALFLLLRELLPNSPTSVASMLQTLGVGKSQCYELKERLRETLPELLDKPGRRPAKVMPDAEVATLKACLAYVTQHPGAISPNRSRGRYSEGFRNFVFDLVAPGGPAESMGLENLAELTGVPLGTLKGWLSKTATSPRAKEDELEGADAAGTAPDIEKSMVESGTAPDWLVKSNLSAQLKTIISLWPSWEGTFQAFCQTISVEFRIPRGPTFIGNLLEMTGLRQRRSRKPKENPWSRGTFRTLFPGAQWLGDGTSLAIEWNSQRFVFNIEALLDTASNAVVGFAVTDSEDVQALSEAYESSLETTQGLVPLAVTLDNKPCNTCDAAVAALDETLLLYGTPGRGQSKAALEGAFGLFAQAMPPLVVSGDSDRETARSALQVVLTAWYRGRNGRPRKRFNGKTPAQVFLESSPSPEEVAKCLQWFRELERRQEAARLTLEAHRDPVRFKLLKTGLVECAISDPEDSLAKGLACFCRESISRGLALFEAKRKLEILPKESHLHGPYLGGIIKNLHTKLELELFIVHLMKQRRRARDLSLEPLEYAANKLRANTSKEELPKAFLQHALEAEYEIDFLFWSRATLETFLSLTMEQREALHKNLTRRIANAFNTDRERRADLIDQITDCVVLAA